MHLRKHLTYRAADFVLMQFVVVLFSIATLVIDVINKEHTCTEPLSDDSQRVNLSGLQILKVYHIGQMQIHTPCSL